MKVLIKEPGRMPESREIKNDLPTLQKIVGGYIETVTIATDLVVICNKEGRLKGLPYNCNFWGLDLFGTIIFAGAAGDEFCSLPAEATPKFLGFKEKIFR